MSEFNLPRVEWIEECVPYGQEDWDRDMSYLRGRVQGHTSKDAIDAYLGPAREQMEQRMKLFIPGLWTEALNRSLIQSLSHVDAVALCVRYEREHRTDRLKRRNTVERRRRRNAIRRRKRGSGQ